MLRGVDAASGEVLPTLDEAEAPKVATIISDSPRQLHGYLADPPTR